MKAGHGKIIRDRDDAFRVLPRCGKRIVRPVERFGPSVKIDLAAIFRSDDLPRMSHVQPVVGLFDLQPVFYLLHEQPVIVPEPVGHGRQLAGRQGILQAGGQPRLAAVAEVEAFFLLVNFVEGNPEIGGDGRHAFFHVKTEYVLFQAASEDVFH